MAFIIICPNCQTHNDSANSRCQDCRSSLDNLEQIDTSDLLKTEIQMVEILPNSPKTITEFCSDNQSFCPKLNPKGKVNKGNTHLFCVLCADIIEEPSIAGTWFFEFPWGLEPIVESVQIGRKIGLFATKISNCGEAYQNVSRLHAAVRLINGDLILEHLSSTNETLVNQKSVKEQEHQLQHGDRIHFGADLIVTVKKNALK